MRPRRFAGVFAVASALVCASAGAEAQRLPVRTGYVTDEAKLLEAHARERLEQTLARFHARSGSELVVLIVERLPGGTLERFSRRTMEGWELGAGARNAILVSVAVAESRMRIEVPAALAAVLTDAERQRILADIRPSFRAGDITGGIELSLGRIIAEVSPEPVSTTAAAAAGAPAPAAPASSAARLPAVRTQNYGRVFILLILGTIFGGMLMPRAGIVRRLRYVLSLAVAVVWFVVLQRYLSLPLLWHAAASVGGGALAWFGISISTGDEEDPSEREHREERERLWDRIAARSGSGDTRSRGETSSDDDRP